MYFRGWVGAATGPRTPTAIHCGPGPPEELSLEDQLAAPVGQPPRRPPSRVLAELVRNEAPAPPLKPSERPPPVVPSPWTTGRPSGAGSFLASNGRGPDGR